MGRSQTRNTYIPPHLKLKSYSKNNSQTFRETTPSLIIKNNSFDILTKKSKDYYALIITKKAQFSTYSLVLKRDFNLSDDQLEKAFLLPHIICSEAYVKGTVSRFGACPYYIFACARFIARPAFFIVYEPVGSELPNFVCK